MFLANIHRVVVFFFQIILGLKECRILLEPNISFSVLKTCFLTAASQAAFWLHPWTFSCFTTNRITFKKAVFIEKPTRFRYCILIREENMEVQKEEYT